MSKDYIALKWGSLKRWSCHSEEAVTAVMRYQEEPVCMSAAAQRDTPEQKAALLDLIDAVDASGGEIWLDWDGRQVTKEEAKTYVLEYGKS